MVSAFVSMWHNTIFCFNKSNEIIRELKVKKEVLTVLRLFLQSKRPQSRNEALKMTKETTRRNTSNREQRRGWIPDMTIAQNRVIEIPTSGKDSLGNTIATK